jgi:teichuronic acid biosynthesis glycosyltransferase TuaC
MERICILCSQYPNKVTPTCQVFVQQFVWALADRGIECTVICPLPINLKPALFKLPESTSEITDNGSIIKIYYPRFVSFGQQTIFGIKTARITTNLFHRAVKSTWLKLGSRPDVIYGHFFTPAGISAARISKQYKVRSFAAYGESSPWSIVNYGLEKIITELKPLSGVVAVSSANQKELESLKILPKAKIRVFPNGIRVNRFFPRNKAQARTKLGIKQDLFLVAYLGHFSERKGVLRVAEAVKGLEDVHVAFAGNGPQQPVVPNCVFNDVVKPEDVPDFLSAADIFVLPTLNEGCSNALIEAMACGLPIVSSDLPFNKDILNSENSILVNPGKIQEIRNAIIYLKNNPAACKSMSEASLRIASRLSITQRAANIHKWIEETSTSKAALV